jgi:hypothetical protein
LNESVGKLTASFLIQRFSTPSASASRSALSSGDVVVIHLQRAEILGAEVERFERVFLAAQTALQTANERE